MAAEDGRTEAVRPGGSTLHTPRGSLMPWWGGWGRRNVRVGGDSSGVAHGAEVRRISTGRRRAVGTSTPLSRLWKIECRGVVDARWVGGRVGNLGAGVLSVHYC